MPYNDLDFNWSGSNDWNRNRDRYNNDYDYDRRYNRNDYDLRNDYERNTYNGGYSRGYNESNRDRYNRGDYDRNRHRNDWRNDERRYDDRRYSRENDRWNDYTPSVGTYTGYAGQMGPTEGIPGWGTGRDYDERNYNEHRRNYDNDSGDRKRNDRDWWDRTTDEVASWFGDEDAERRRERDKQEDYRGKGPKNYKRSEERIREDVSDRLSDHPYIDASDIEVSVTGSEVTLTGTVDSKQTKRRAEDVAESVSGVTDVHNQLRVRSTINSTESSLNIDTVSGNKAPTGSNVTRNNSTANMS